MIRKKERTSIAIGPEYPECFVPLKFIMRAKGRQQSYAVTAIRDQNSQYSDATGGGYRAYHYLSAAGP